MVGIKSANKDVLKGAHSALLLLQKHYLLKCAAVVDFILFLRVYFNRINA